MICYVLAMGKQHLGPHVVVGYGIKIFWPGLFITSPDHLVNKGMKMGISRGGVSLIFCLPCDIRVHVHVTVSYKCTYQTSFSE